MTDSYFSTTADGLLPAPHANAPWADDMLHGRLIGGLAARAIEAQIGGPGAALTRRVARLTVDLFRPAGMVPVTVTTTPVRRGRRIEVIDVSVRSDGHDVARVTALVLATSSAPPGSTWQPSPAPWPDPDALAAEDPDQRWQFRVVAGGFNTGERSRVWTNDTVSLVDGEPMSPLVRAAVSGDLACPLANSSDAGLHYINADYTLALGRYPVGPWVGLEVAHHIAADGIAVGGCTLVDRAGPFATSSGASVTTTPMVDP